MTPEGQADPDPYYARMPRMARVSRTVIRAPSSSRLRGAWAYFAAASAGVSGSRTRRQGGGRQRRRPSRRASSPRQPDMLVSTTTDATRLARAGARAAQPAPGRARRVTPCTRSSTSYSTSMAEHGEGLNCWLRTRSRCRAAPIGETNGRPDRRTERAPAPYPKGARGSNLCSARRRRRPSRPSPASATTSPGVSRYRRRQPATICGRRWSTESWRAHDRLADGLWIALEATIGLIAAGLEAGDKPAGPADSWRRCSIPIVLADWRARSPIIASATVEELLRFDNGAVQPAQRPGTRRTRRRAVVDAATASWSPGGRPTRDRAGASAGRTCSTSAARTTRH